MSLPSVHQKGYGTLVWEATLICFVIWFGFVNETGGLARKKTNPLIRKAKAEPKLYVIHLGSTPLSQLKNVMRFHSTQFMHILYI